MAVTRRDAFMVTALLGLTVVAGYAASSWGERPQEPQLWYVRRDVAVRTVPSTTGNEPVAIAERGESVMGISVRGEVRPDVTWLLITEGTHTGLYVSEARMSLTPPPSCTKARAKRVRLRFDQIVPEPYLLREVESAAAAATKDAAAGSKEPPETEVFDVVCRLNDPELGSRVYEVLAPNEGGVLYGREYRG